MLQTRRAAAARKIRILLQRTGKQSQASFNKKKKKMKNTDVATSQIFFKTSPFHPVVLVNLLFVLICRKGKFFWSKFEMLGKKVNFSSLVLYWYLPHSVFSLSFSCSNQKSNFLFLNLLLHFYSFLGPDRCQLWLLFSELFQSQKTAFETLETPTIGEVVLIRVGTYPSRKGAG